MTGASRNTFNKTISGSAVFYNRITHCMTISTTGIVYIREEIHIVRMILSLKKSQNLSFRFLFYQLITAVLILVSQSGYAQSGDPVPLLLKKSVSKQNISLLQKSAAQNGEQTFHILAIRAEFQADDSQFTTGDGTFDYSVETEAVVDPPPHDRVYFLDQLEALKRYYNRVSNGMASIKYDLYPAGDREAYTLPNLMEYYNPNTTDDELNQRLGELVRDAVERADADPLIDFSLYNAVIIFHAGVGADFAFNSEEFDPTPFDIPSAFLNLNDLRSSVGNDQNGYLGIQVDGGAVHVTNAIILPETESKQGIELGLNGIAAHQFGHYFGLPPLFNTVNGRTGIGKWGVMDIGFGNLDGVVPPEPSAWSKVFLGWETPVVVTQGSELTVVPPEAVSGTKIYKVPISPTEYFLIENRQQDFAGDNLKVVRGASGVILEVDDYDIDVPGSGILIWHIDERIIAAGLSSNSVNNDPDIHGIDLEEADGSQDIGESFSGILPGFATPANGIPTDAFFEGNNTVFTPVSVPASLSNDRANSQISITGISESGNMMTFSVVRDRYVDGFPLYLGGDFTNMVPIWTNPLSADSVKLIIPSKDGKIFALNGSNQPFVDNGSTAIKTDSYSNEEIVPIPLFIDVGESLAGAPAFAGNESGPENLRNKLVVVTEKPELQVYSLQTESGGQFGNREAQWDLQTALSVPVMLSRWIVVGGIGGVTFYDAGGVPVNSYSTGNIVIGLTATGASSRTPDIFVITSLGLYFSFFGTQFEQGGNLGVDQPYSPLLTDLDSDGLDELTAVTPDGTMVTIRGESESFNLQSSVSGDPATGDVNGDGFRNIVIFDDNAIRAYSHNGTLLPGFPMAISSFGLSGSISTELILGDVNGDGKQNILFGTTAGSIVAIDDNSSIVPGFPLPLGSSAAGSLTLQKSTLEDRMELAALDSDGYLYLWNLTTYSDKDIAWSTLGGNNERLRHNIEPLTTIVASPSTLLMPKERVFNWPNPNEDNWTNIRYFLNHPADVRVKIFTQIGELVANMTGPGTPQVDNEITWNLTGINSGVYFAEVSASGNGLHETKVIKIAVIK